MITKICTKCKQPKPISAFYKKERGYYGVAAECKECNIKRTARRYAAKRDELRPKENAYNRDKNRRIKDAAFAAYGGYVCACCGETEKEFLTLDHLNNDGNEHRKQVAGRTSGAGVWTYRWAMNNGYPPIFQVLCMNCNWGKRKTGVCPHKLTCNDYSKEVGPSGPKRSTPVLTLIKGRDEDIVSSESKDSAVGATGELFPSVEKLKIS